jgi:hypothetical protein
VPGIEASRDDAGIGLCYSDTMECVRDCTDGLLASPSSQDPWETVAQCTDGCVRREDSEDTELFPHLRHPGANLIECIIGSSPRDQDAGAATEDDAGARRPCGYWGGTCFPESDCAAVCFPGWPTAAAAN